MQEPGEVGMWLKGGTERQTGQEADADVGTNFSYLVSCSRIRYVQIKLILKLVIYYLFIVNINSFTAFLYNRLQ